LYGASRSCHEVLDELIPKVLLSTLKRCINTKLQNRHAHVNLLYHGGYYQWIRYKTHANTEGKLMARLTDFHRQHGARLKHRDRGEPCVGELEVNPTATGGRDHGERVGGRHFGDERVRRSRRRRGSSRRRQRGGAGGEGDSRDDDTGGGAGGGRVTTVVEGGEHASDQHLAPAVVVPAAAAVLAANRVAAVANLVVWCKTAETDG
jgi:hypothetical protein